jgi:hypothetical protein
VIVECGVAVTVLGSAVDWVFPQEVKNMEIIVVTNNTTPKN